MKKGIIQFVLFLFIGIGLIIFSFYHFNQDDLLNYALWIGSWMIGTFFIFWSGRFYQSIISNLTNHNLNITSPKIPTSSKRKNIPVKGGTKNKWKI